MCRYILFDFDGTLVDTNDLIIQTLKETSKQCLKKEISGIELNAILGRHLKDQMNNKPHPEPVLKALDLLRASPAEAIIVGDSPYDIICGKNAGIKTVLVDWSILPKNELLETLPNFIIKTPMDLIEIIS